jgi:ATP-dependent RNA helicase HelY
MALEEATLPEGERKSLVDSFEATYGFGFDAFQRRACEALVEGSSVLVAAPTGAGKTVVGEFAAWLALRGAGKTFYTTPIKALSNQKYTDFLGLHGVDNVGLLTGDNSINGDGQVVVMTTEVLRNMIYEDSPTLAGLEYVVLDEVHYLQDRYRGAVWEEILIHLPVDVKIISLSATVSNAEEFAEWLQTLRGRTEVLIEEKRPVEIRHWYFASDELMPLFVHKPDGTPIPNPRGREMDQRRRKREGRPQRGGRRSHMKRTRMPLRTEVVDRLQAEDMLPAIYFIFSRKGCDAAVRQCLMDNVRLTAADERKVIREYADSRVAEFSPNELDVLGYDDWISGLVRGVAAHHAGMIPPFKEVVEELFARGVIKVVFATETLALGINMPARSVAIESLMKFTGERHEQMTPGEYTQLSGRAGRRGIDELGHSIVLLQRFLPFDAVTRLASTRTYPLVSSFAPSYNMAVNLVRTYDQAEAEHLVNSSFAQFQADRDVVQMEQTKEKLQAYMSSYKEKTTCHLGDFDEYRKIHARLSRRAGERGTRGKKGRGERGREKAIHALVEDDEEVLALREELRAHPCHKCPEIGRHLHFADRAARLRKEISGIDRRVNRRTGTLSRRFDEVVGVLEELGYVDAWRLTEKGEMLSKVYNEADLLVVESLERHLYDDLDAAELAAILSTLVYESRGPDPPSQVDLPTSAAAEVWRQVMKLWRQIRRKEEARGLELTRQPDPGFAMTAYLWASGNPLENVLDEDDAAGDFVRSTKQLIDLLRQVEDATRSDALLAKVQAAGRGLQRGVVAYSSLEL